MNRITVTGIVCKEPVLFLNAGADIKKSQLRLTIVENYYKGQGKEPGKNFHDLTLFGDYGANMAQFLTKGLLVQVDGHLTIHPEESTERKPDGKPVKIYSSASITGQVRLLNTPKKYIVAEINKNLNALIGQGLLPPAVASMGEKLYNPINGKAKPFDMNVVNATGMWGYARVWDKQKGAWVKSMPTTAVTPTMPAVGTDAFAAVVAGIIAQMGIAGVKVDAAAVAAAAAGQNAAQNAAVADANALGDAIAEQEVMVPEIMDAVDLGNAEDAGDILGM